ncbi:class I SAM-dependent methyltransferase [Sphingomonas sp.]|uniref:class I SAM-dependent methyltransferase n=1 Tax=Sphingomonas sp. TaxID=28214 RepID=UPI003CC545E0
MSRPRFGIDAPTAVRNLALAAVFAAAAALATRGLAPLAPLRPLVPTLAGTAVACTAMTAWMLVSSLVLKQRLRDRLLRERQWRGDERVLDVGCGRGLFAIGAAARVPQGSVVGLDRWQAADLSGNTPAAFLANAAAAGVAGRVTVETGDATALPFADDSFDVVGSMTVIHNIPAAADRDRAVAELWRVTRSGGQILLFDIRHARTYARQLRALGAELRLRGPILLWGVVGWRFSATKPL